MLMHMLLQVDSNGRLMVLRDPVRLFDGSLAMEHAQALHHQVELAGSLNDVVRLEHTEHAPCIVLQHNSGSDYSLKHNKINAGIRRYESYSAADMQSRWKSARLRVSQRLNDERLYLVHCIDHMMLSWRRVDEALKPLGAAYPAIRNDEHLIEHSGFELSEWTLRALEVAACRALYALWLDVGSVLVAVSGTGSMAIRGVWSIAKQQLPIDRELLSEAITAWLKRWKREAEAVDHNERNERIQLGADPEFILVNEQQRVVSATEYLLESDSMYVGIDALWYRNKLIHPIVELRPPPETDPNRLFASLYRLLKETATAITDKRLRWLAGGMPVRGIALGGHLHISGVQLTPRVLRILDAALAIPFAAAADQNGAGRLRKFGGLGDYRRQFHGGFEYRTLPSWLVSPALTKAAIACCYIAVLNNKELAIQLKSADWLDDAYAGEDREQLHAKALDMLQLLSKLASNTPEYKLEKAIAPLQHAIRQRKTWNEQDDIRKRWSLLEAGEIDKAYT